MTVDFVETFTNFIKTFLNEASNNVYGDNKDLVSKINKYSLVWEKTQSNPIKHIELVKGEISKFITSDLQNGDIRANLDLLLQSLIKDDFKIGLVDSSIPVGKILSLTNKSRHDVLLYEIFCLAESVDIDVLLLKAFHSQKIALQESSKKITPKEVKKRMKRTVKKHINTGISLIDKIIIMSKNNPKLFEMLGVGNPKEIIKMVDSIKSIISDKKDIIIEKFSEYDPSTPEESLKKVLCDGVDIYYGKAQSNGSQDEDDDDNETIELPSELEKIIENPQQAIQDLMSKKKKKKKKLK